MNQSGQKVMMESKLEVEETKKIKDAKLNSK